MPKASTNPYLLALWVAMLLLAAGIENPPDFTALPLADYHAYASLYDHFASGEENKVRFPFQARIGMPFLAALLPFPMEQAFLIVNAILLVSGFWIWLRIWNHMHLASLSKVIITLFIGLHFAGPLRLNCYDGVGTDASQFLLIALLVYALIKEKGVLLFLVLGLFTIFKESSIPLGIFILLRTLSSYSTQKNLFFWTAGGLFLALCILLYLRQLYPGLGAPRWGSLSSVYYYVRTFLLEPWRILLAAASFGMAFGYFPLLLRKGIHRFPDALSYSLLGMTLTLVALSLMGGQDYTRLVFFALPPFLSYLFYKNPLPFRQSWAVILLSFTLTCAWQAIPNAAIAPQAFSSIFLEYASPAVAAKRLLWFLAGGALLLLISHFSSMGKAEVLS
jgi:hypothetical protein